ncbi:MAG: GNAT family N-acetyltransferase [Planctomycetota bacterium]|jgi:RimJ/RimL family protein N-acetyltransferase
MCNQPDSPTGELRIDRLSADDVTPLTAFYRSLSPHVVRTYRPYGWEVTAEGLRDGPLANIATGDEYAMVVRDEAGTIWGHAFLSNVSSGSAPFGIGLHQALLGRRFGRKLMAALLDGAEQDCDLREIRLTCVQDNKAAVDLYTSLGFERTGEFIAEDDNLPYYRMRKPLA